MAAQNELGKLIGSFGVPFEFAAKRGQALLALPVFIEKAPLVCALLFDPHVTILNFDLI